MILPTKEELASMSREEIEAEILRVLPEIDKVLADIEATIDELKAAAQAPAKAAD